MSTLAFDRPAPAMTDEEDAQTVEAIRTGIVQIEAGLGIPLEELRRELAKRCTK